MLLGRQCGHVVCCMLHDVLLATRSTLVRPPPYKVAALQRAGRSGIKTRGNENACMATDTTHVCLERFRHIVPSLSAERYKGQAGKIAVIGGCREYTGAPFFAAITALRVGADLSHVFCTEGAATVIKSYSPDLIVHPYIPSTDEGSSQEQQAALVAAVARTDIWLDKFQAVVVGPGLGRDTIVLQYVAQVLPRLRQLGIPVIIDADGLFLVTQQLHLVAGWNTAILTPNVAEYRRLAKAAGIAEDADGQELCRALQGPLLLRKGPADHVYGPGDIHFTCTTEGSPRRCGGQGDVLSGACAAFAAWAQSSKQNAGAEDLAGAAMLACITARRTAAAAFAKHHRSMVTQDLLSELGPVMQQLFPV